MSTGASTAGTRSSSRSRRRSGHLDSATAKKKSYGPSANALGQSVDASKRINDVYELLLAVVEEEPRKEGEDQFEFHCIRALNCGQEELNTG